MTIKNIIRVELIVFILFTFMTTFFSQNAFASEGDVWLIPVSQDVTAGSSFDAEVHMDTGTKDIGAFNMYLDFDDSDVMVDIDSGDDGISVGDDTGSYMLDVNTDNISSGHYRFAGVCNSSSCSGGSDVHLVTIHMDADSGFTSGSSDLSLRVNELSDELGGNISTGSITDATVNAVSVDTTAPTVSSPSPTGALSSGTTHTTISVHTNENATCKYGTVSNRSYSSISNTFSTTGSTAHSASVSGLSNGHSYTYYVRCKDSSNNENTSDTVISFSVSSASSGGGDDSSGGSSGSSRGGGGTSNNSGASVSNTSGGSGVTTGATQTLWNRNLTIGSRGSDVLALQKVLISKGYLSIKAPTTYFGQLTKSALIRYQKANGIYPTSGYFGPKTRAYMNKYNSGSGSSTASTKQGELSLKEIVNLFLALGIIPEEKRDVALSAISGME